MPLLPDSANVLNRRREGIRIIQAVFDDLDGEFFDYVLSFADLNDTISVSTRFLIVELFGCLAFVTKCLILLEDKELVNEVPVGQWLLANALIHLLLVLGPQLDEILPAIMLNESLIVDLHLYWAVWVRLVRAR